ncbi:MAG: hypothetical protein JJ975_12645 [Bacteroidia bacterium]|nr:hypothetical protein [Bacteroidia bacterium]
MKPSTIRFCLACHSEVKGRADKKFCDDQCRNNYHNQQNRASSIYMKQINKILRRNRLILQNLVDAGKTRTSKLHLQQLGFNFDYHTHSAKVQSGNPYYFCYDKGYQSIENETFALIIKQEHVNGRKME